MHRMESFANSFLFKPAKKPGLLLLLSLLGLAVGCTQETPQSKQLTATTSIKKDDVFICPDGDIKKTGSNDHKVTLTWNPSANSSPSRQIRYCVYRTQDHPIQRSEYPASIGKAPCNSCTRVNETAVSETQYIDTHVTNGAHYCYVAVAMDTGERAFSGFSNQVQADIPQGPAPVPAQISSGKLCDDKKSAAKLLKKPRRR
jgi:hypothetical protein